MDRNGFLALILLVFVVSDFSNASLVLKLRELVGQVPKDKSTTQISPLPSPVSGGKESDPNSIVAGKSNEKKSSDSPVPNNLSKVEPKSSDNTASVSPLIDKQTDNVKEKSDHKTGSQAGIDENCDSSTKPCTDQSKMRACVRSFESGSKELVILVQNGGDSNLKVNLAVMTSARSALKVVEIPGHQTEGINNLTSVGESAKIVLNAGHGDCILHVGPHISEGNHFLRLPSYAKLLTPINAAYFSLLAALIFGGTWICCKFRQRKRHGGVPYQELEMGLPESVSAVDVETAEGWDQGWDDDWDEDKAVKSPGGRHIGNISANGLTSRSSNREGWENDWDD